MSLQFLHVCAATEIRLPENAAHMEFGSNTPGDEMSKRLSNMRLRRGGVDAIVCKSDHLHIMVWRVRYTALAKTCEDKSKVMIKCKQT